MNLIHTLAFLVCYSKSAPDDHTRQDAIYLDQKFYEIIFQHCITKRSCYAILSVVASLRYKSPILVVTGGELDLLVAELINLEEVGHFHPQLTEFRQVCRRAKADCCSLSVSGDMYPEL